MDAFAVVDYIKALVAVLSSYLIVQHLDNRHKLGHYLLKVSYRPLFQGLRQNGVVGIGASLAYRLDSVVHIKTAQIKQTDKLGDNHGRVSVVYLNNRVIRKVV